MIIRKATILDSKVILEWRNDPLTRSMFFENSKINFNEHNKWFKKNLNSKSNLMFIGEISKKKFGICRFDLNKRKKYAEISINLNPKFRGKGLSKKFLKESIKIYSKINMVDLIARVKVINLNSIKLFEKNNFIKKRTKANEIFYILPANQLSFKKVNINDSELLYDLLKKRKYKISHKLMPSYKNHKKFIKSQPYVHWYIVREKEAIGTFYIKNDNSIGLNLIKIKEEWIEQIKNYIIKNFKPYKQIPSKIPPYFYINSSIKNTKMIKTFKMLNIEPIQITHKIL
tara:strand:+ start:24606 stop:25463 length:858 start_codon:yes stop_codon:yes gene_type:complete